MKRYEIHTTAVYMVGDIHGAFKAIPYNIKQRGLHDCAIIFCGDIGMGFERMEGYRPIFTKISKTLKEKNVHVYFFRGNHDDPSYFDGKHFNRYAYIHLIPDYSVLSVYGEDNQLLHNILCVGGATSIDRLLRMNRDEKKTLDYQMYHNVTYDEAKLKAARTYWKNEAAVYDEAAIDELTSEGVSIDTVCTHTCPSFCQPTTKGGVGEWIRYDKELSVDLDNERKVMDDIYGKLVKDGHPLREWIYGHFHFHNFENINGVNFRLQDMELNGNFDIFELR